MLCTQSNRTRRPYAMLRLELRPSSWVPVVKVVRDRLAAKTSQNEAAQATTSRQHL